MGQRWRFRFPLVGRTAHRQALDLARLEQMEADRAYWRSQLAAVERQLADTRAELGTAKDLRARLLEQLQAARDATARVVEEAVEVRQAFTQTTDRLFIDLEEQRRLHAQALQGLTQATERVVALSTEMAGLQRIGFRQPPPASPQPSNAVSDYVSVLDNDREAAEKYEALRAADDL